MRMGRGRDMGSDIGMGAVGGSGGSVGLSFGSRRRRRGMETGRATPFLVCRNRRDRLEQMRTRDRAVTRWRSRNRCRCRGRGRE